MEDRDRFLTATFAVTDRQRQTAPWVGGSSDSWGARLCSADLVATIACPGMAKERKKENGKQEHE